MPTRRSKNQNLKGCYTYHEKQKDKAQMSYGNFERRLAKDSIRDFDMCCLTLQPCVNPIATPEGVIYDRPSILEYIVKQKDKNKIQKMEYQNYVQSKKDEIARKDRIDKQKEINQFIKTTDSLVVKSDPLDNPLRSVRGDKTPAVASNSFWVAGSVRDSVRGSFSSLTDGRGILKRKLDVNDGTGLMDGTGFGGKVAKVIEKPSKHVFCPITGNPIEYSKLIKLKFKKIDENQTKSTNKSNIVGTEPERESRYVCAISGDPLTNATKLVVIKTTGDVVSSEAFDKAVKPTMICPFTMKKLEKTDVLELRRAGTGFASVNDLQKTEKSAAFMAS